VHREHPEQRETAGDVDPHHARHVGLHVDQGAGPIVSGGFGGGRGGP
jgi:hypothetical protein